MAEPAEPERPPSVRITPSVLRALCQNAEVRPLIRLRDPSADAGIEQSTGSEVASKYRVGDEIGSGGVGVVRMGYDVDLGRPVAVKFLHDKFCSNEVVLQRFIEEAQIGGQLQHPGVVPVYDLGLADGKPFFTMRLVKGRTLAALLQESDDVQADRGRLLSIFEQVCQTMAYAHARGVVHRDLKPDNVMIGAFGEVQVVDWGLGKVLHDDADTDAMPLDTALSVIETIRSQSTSPHSQIGSIMGTPSYMPPEQARGEIDQLDERSDVFSLGAILCEILTGSPPYVGEPGDIVLAAARAQLDPARKRLADSGADPALIELANSCLIPGRAARPANAGVVAERMAAFLTAAEHRAQEAQIRSRAAQRTKRMALAFGAIVAAALVVSLVFWQRAVQAADDARVAERREKSAREDADNKAGELRTALDRYDLLANVVRLREAEVAETDLYPAWPDRAEAMQSWLASQGRPLAQALPKLETTLTELRARAVSQDGDDHRFAAKGDQFLHDTLAQLVAGLRVFADPDHGKVAAVGARLAWAREVHEASIGGHTRAWAVTTGAIAGDPKYGGLVLTPQMGLVPLGPDPKSGLQEFAHLRSGTPPERNPETGQLTRSDDTGVIFVLVPAGTFPMGAQSEDPNAAGYDAGAEAKEAPRHPITLSAFFLSKFEMTQAQWRRATGGSNPSGYPAPKKIGKVADITWQHPVENVSWFDCVELLHQHGLALPTEAQWEYACRAGSATPWSSGPTPSSLQGHANVADASAKKAGTAWQIEPSIEDGHVLHAPVGSFHDNAFGFHDMHGNVWEWCRDGSGSYDQPARAGDGLRETEKSKARVSRGGSFAFPALQARTTNRYFDSPETRDFNLGLRPMRPVVVE